MTYAARAFSYCRMVVGGETRACRYVKAACQRHLDDLLRSVDDPTWPYVFDAEKAGRICSFIELLPHVEGKWARPVLQDGRYIIPRITLEDWQIFQLACLFGWVSRETGLRRFRRAYIEEARKNAKSTIAAGIALYMTAADGEEGAQVYSQATKKDQAKIVWGVAKRMLQREPDFRYLGMAHNASAIFHEPTGSIYKPLGRDSDTQDGLSAHCFVSDELHAQRDRGLYDVLDSSTGARAQPLGIAITTAGSNTAGVCYEQRSYLISVLNKTLLAHGGMGYKVDGAAHDDETYFGIIYTIDHGYADVRPDDDWADEQHWIKANPNLGISQSLEDMRAKCTRAKASAQSQAEFRTKHCNQWVGADLAWMDMHQWNACADPTLKPEQFAHAECVIGLDAAFKTDIFAKLKVFHRDGHYYAFGEYWVPAPPLEEKTLAHLKAWANDGWLHTPDVPVLDVEPVKESIRADSHLHVVKQIAYDPAQLTQFAGEMLDEGFEMVEVPARVLHFSEPMKRLQELVIQKRFHHNGDPVLAWMIGNVIFHRDEKDNIYPRKDKLQPWKKIDGVIALIMALSRLIARTEPEAKPQLFFVG